MKRYFAPIILAASLALSACGGSKSAGDAGSDSVEMPAEEAMSGLDAAATPMADPNANTIPMGDKPVVTPTTAAHVAASSAETATNSAETAVEPKAAQKPATPLQKKN
jgi:hypothetical protein